MKVRQKQKLLVLTSTYPRWENDWEPAFVHELSRRLTNSFEVTVICPREKGSARRETRDNVKVLRYRYAPENLSTLVSNGGIAANVNNQPIKWALVPFFLISQIIAIIVAMKKHKPDVIHCHWIIPQGACLYVAKKLTRSTIPQLLTSHGGDMYSFKGKFPTRLKKAALLQSSSITVVSQTMVKEAERIANRRLDISVIPMGIDTKNIFQPDESVKRSNTEILFVGRLVEKKGVEYLLKSIPQTINAIPDLTLTIIGEGPERKKLERLCVDLMITNRVNFIGSIENDKLPSYYNKAAALVAPFITARTGDEDGFGLVVAEALCCNCPVIVTSIEATQDIRTLYPDKERLLEIPANSSKDISIALIKLLQNETHPPENDGRFRNLIDWNTISLNYTAALEQQTGTIYSSPN